MKPPEDSVELHQRCPLCWEGLRGFGHAQRTAGRTRYYKCIQHLGNAQAGDDSAQFGQKLSGGCGHNWSVQLQVVETIIVEQRVVPVSIRDVQVEKR